MPPCEVAGLALLRMGASARTATKKAVGIPRTQHRPRARCRALDFGEWRELSPGGLAQLGLQPCWPGRPSRRSRSRPRSPRFRWHRPGCWHRRPLREGRGMRDSMLWRSRWFRGPCHKSECRSGTPARRLCGAMFHRHRSDRVWRLSVARRVHITAGLVSRGGMPTAGASRPIHAGRLA